VNAVISDRRDVAQMAGSSRSEFGEEEVQISFVRSDGKERSVPVWFTVEGGSMELLPMYGLKTKWFVDVEKSGSIGLSIKGWKKEAKPRVVRAQKAVEEIKGRFGVKYGAANVKRYYPTSEVALEIPV
jgi:hypothetical protein